MKAHHQFVAAAALCTAAVALSSCASEDNIYTQARPEKADIAIAIDGASNEQVVLGAVSYTHLTLPTTLHECRSRWSPYH